MHDKISNGIGTDINKDGVFVHLDEEENELGWINHKWNCGDGRDNFYTQGGDGILLGLSDNSHSTNGAWCDADFVEDHRFICERDESALLIK